MTTIPLKKPITIGDQQITSVEIDEPCVGAIEAFENAKAAKESDMTAMVKMLAAEFDWPVAAVRKMRTSDLVKISDALAPFVGADGHTGE
ncbi:phage tail assembly protein [Tardiphaga sp. 71_E8_N1_1]|uniref:phage tail assembly protein n=1 Tax=Tardiphaga sp. 71_E8_N1_1 TaxID=3240784 RepID=UPI003F8915CE